MARNGFHELKEAILTQKDGVGVIELEGGAAIVRVSQEKPPFSDAQAGTMRLDGSLQEKVVRVFDPATSTVSIRIGFLPSHDVFEVERGTQRKVGDNLSVHVGTVPSRNVEVGAKTFQEGDPLLTLAKRILELIRTTVPESETPLRDRLELNSAR